MIRSFTLEYWIDDGWHVGKLREVPGIFSQGANLEELKINIKDAYDLMMKETTQTPAEKFGSEEMKLEIP